MVTDPFTRGSRMYFILSCLASASIISVRDTFSMMKGMLLSSFGARGEAGCSGVVPTGWGAADGCAEGACVVAGLGCAGGLADCGGCCNAPGGIGDGMPAGPLT